MSEPADDRRPEQLPRTGVGWTAPAWLLIVILVAAVALAIALYAALR